MSDTTTPDRLFASPSLPEIELQGRMEVVYSSHGFLPHTKDELNEVMSIDAVANKAGGVASHLNEVLLHQQKARTDRPDQAVRSIVQEYSWYARQAHRDSADLLLFNHRFQDMLNPHVSVFDYLEDLEADLDPRDPDYMIGARQIVRYLDLDRFRQTGQIAGVSSDILKKQSRERKGNGTREIVDVYSTKDEAINEYVNNRMKEISVGELRQGANTVVEQAVDASINRFDYFVDVLRASRAHLLARPIAERALASLFTESKVES